MPQETIAIGPLDTRYTAHRDVAHRREETRQWLKQRERELGLVQVMPSVTPEHPSK